MTPTSLGHDLTRRDTADLTRCPLERLADRMNDAPKPKWLKVSAGRLPWGTARVELTFEVSRVESIQDVIQFLARAVK